MSCTVTVIACLGYVSEVEIVAEPHDNSILRRIDWSKTGVSFVVVKSFVPIDVLIINTTQRQDILNKERALLVIDIQCKPSVYCYFLMIHQRHSWYPSFFSQNCLYVAAAVRHCLLYF